MARRVVNIPKKPSRVTAAYLGQQRLALRGLTRGSTLYRDMIFSSTTWNRQLDLFLDGFLTYWHAVKICAKRIKITPSATFAGSPLLAISSILPTNPASFSVSLTRLPDNPTRHTPSVTMMSEVH